MSELAVEVILFDKDGTLINFELFWIDWIQKQSNKFETESKGEVSSSKWARAVGYDLLTKQLEPDAPLISCTFKELQSIWCKQVVNVWKPQWSESEQLNWLQCNEISITSVDSVVPVSPFLEKMLTECVSKGIKLGICTADKREHTVYMLSKLQWVKYFDVLVCGDDDGIFPKPHPSMINKACETLNVNCKNVIYVGDTVKDMQMGIAAGCKSQYGVQTHLVDPNDLRKFCIDVLDDVSHLLKKIF
jgi:phosphoglycolate phosphatase